MQVSNITSGNAFHTNLFLLVKNNTCSWTSSWLLTNFVILVHTETVSLHHHAVSLNQIEHSEQPACRHSAVVVTSVASCYVCCTGTNQTNMDVTIAAASAKNFHCSLCSDSPSQSVSQSHDDCRAVLTPISCSLLSGKARTREIICIEIYTPML